MKERARGPETETRQQGHATSALSGGWRGEQPGPREMSRDEEELLSESQQRQDGGESRVLV